ncbi:hypothetical protein SYNPS1DRAFT_25415 [Syncephalis pseudoplumigaleata]|uniref:Formamidopyrimidine-DNA glycosylase catalytic domain-containing protein n=1 Tax=Syncephalis pseudoplumigaleata TaxID=1712513 RepID=A0A4V1J0U0_9FUNG|nr:hypothetical protein SYNPS1DRAFT_25415 [Syncephalis pseudoplumigaleata]|eukprot:RKP22729.1 hypothetical protein SYNPS1DRAFT_25415 [Syncephalis pseudoplumigaleata]
MPELPEVERARRLLEERCLGCEVVSVKVVGARMGRRHRSMRWWAAVSSWWADAASYSSSSSTDRLRSCATLA